MILHQISVQMYEIRNRKQHCEDVDMPRFIIFFSYIKLISIFNWHIYKMYDVGRNGKISNETIASTTKSSQEKSVGEKC